MKIKTKLNLFAYPFLFIGIALLIGSAFFAYNFISAQKMKAVGIVERVDIEYGSKGSRYEIPTITYEDNEGVTKKFTPTTRDTVSHYEVGQELPVLYDPKGAWIDTPFQLYFPFYIPAIIGLIFVSFAAIFIYLLNPQDKGLKRVGTKVPTKYLRTEYDNSLEINGRTPVRIVSVGELGGVEVTFYSSPLLEDPGEISREYIDVYVDRKNKKRYYMDISFLEDKK